MAAPMAPLTMLGQCLEWMGFVGQEQAALEAELGTIERVSSLTKKDVLALQTSYASRTLAEGRIHFGLARTKLLLALADWVKDFARIGEEPSIDDLDEADFLDELSVAEQRASIRALEEDSAGTRAREASPGKLSNESMWDKWAAGLEVQLSILTGVQGVPLVYVIRQREAPDADQTFDSFVAESIAKCPLTGPRFEADARQVHHIIASLTTGEISEEWIRDKRRHQNGRVDMMALRAHYQGEGNQTRRIGDAERLRETLHYRAENALPFSTFLAKCQQMFNLFEQVSEPYSEAMKLRFLLEKVQSIELKVTIEAIKSAVALDANSYTFTSAANHLSAQIKPRVGNGRSLSSVSVGEGSSKIMKGGKINTGYYRNWSQLSPEDKQLVLAERDRLGVKGKARRNRQSKDKKTSMKSQIKALTKKVDKQQATISSLKRGSDSKDSEDETDDSASDSNMNSNHAGDAFGGRREKEMKKRNSKKPKTGS
jgi:hypothetical protein